MAMFEHAYERPADKHFRWWHNWAVRSRLKPMIEVGRMLKRRFESIITHLRHQVTKAASESINAKIHWVKCTARDPRQRNPSLQLPPGHHLELPFGLSRPSLVLSSYRFSSRN